MGIRPVSLGLHLIGSLSLILFAGACTKKPPQSLDSLTPEQLVARGKVIYAQNCLACHNADPKLVGQVGPALTNISKEILYYKIVGGNLPAGHEPQRSTAIMPKTPQLEKEIPALEAYLKSLQ